MDRKARGRNAWRIGQCKIALIAERLRGLNFQLAGLWIAVEKQRRFVKI